MNLPRDSVEILAADSKEDMKLLLTHKARARAYFYIASEKHSVDVTDWIVGEERSVSFADTSPPLADTQYQIIKSSLDEVQIKHKNQSKLWTCLPKNSLLKRISFC